MSITRGFFSLIRRDLKLALKGGSGALTGVLFFLAVVTVVPFGVGPDLALLERIGPAMLWVSALLASLLGLERLFQIDREDGSLDVLRMSGMPLGVTVIAKCVAHWITTGLPLIFAVPVFGLLLNVSPTGIGATMLTLLVGTPAITFIGAVGAALTVAMPRGGLLLAVLVLPLAIPVLIFGVSSVYGAVNESQPFQTPFLFLAGISLIFAVVGPIAAAYIIEQSVD